MSAASDAPDVRVVLDEIAAQPEVAWPALVKARFAADPALAAQALCWLRAEREQPPDGDTPRLAGDRYQLGVRLGGGATASVWQAYDTKLGRHVALKVFAARETSSALVESLAEARAACDVISDHVVRVLDVHAERDPAYLVMELVGEHDPERGLLAPGASAAVTRPRSVDEAVRWVRDVARGVHDAHLRNVFHRDVKPANVLVTPVSRRARIADFGLAVSTAGDVAAISLVRGGLRIAGTPEYMAPEQARGLPIELDPREPDQRARLVAIDVWGLGALLYALLAGHAPWSAHEGAEAWEVAARGEAPPSLPRRIPRRLRRVVDKALALAPEARYATAAELAAELDRYLARRPTSLDRSRALRAWLWSRRNPQLAITILVAVGLAVGTLATYLAVVDLRRERRDLRAEIATQEAEIATRATRSARTRAELARTEAELRKESDALVAAERALAEAEREYQGILEANARALRDADAATRSLVDQLARAKTDRDAAQFGRSLYQGYWNAARAEAERLTKERDQAVAARTAAEKERDTAAAARAATEKELARLTAEAAAREAELHELEQRAEAQQPAATVDAGAAAATAPALDAAP
jgi:hypothetical protein